MPHVPSRRQFLIKQSRNLLALSLLPQRSQLGEVSLNRKSERHRTTNWQVLPSFVFDALCFLNLLTGDPFYVGYYRHDYDAFAPKITPKAHRALENVKHSLKDKAGNMVAPYLCLLFSATTDQSLPDMIASTEDSSHMHTAFKGTTYYQEKDWQAYEPVRADLRILLQFLRDIQFDIYWQQTILPPIQKKIKTLEGQLPSYNVVGEDEKVLGFALPSDTIRVYILHYNKPHGIKVTGQRFLTGVDYPPEIVVRNAVHELMHPPFGVPAGSEQARKMWTVLSELKADTLLMDKVTHHNPSFGYNTFEGFIEEDCVQALEQIASERLNIAQEPHRRWKESDEGMHVFAVALYSVMKAERYNRRNERFADFLIAMLHSGKLAPGKIRSLHEQFYAEASK